MKLDRPWRARLPQTPLPISNLSADCKTADVRHALCGIRTSVLRLVSVTVMATLASAPLFAQNEFTGYPDDWTHHHVVFSDPGTMDQALLNGSYEAWRRVVSDSRFAMQRYKRSSGARPITDRREFADGGDQDERDQDEGDHGRKNGGSGLEKDWRRTILTGTVQPNTFPARWSFSTTIASCANDYVVYPTGSAGSTSKANIIAYYNLYTTGCTTGTVPSVYWAYDTSGTVSTSPVLSLDGTQVAFIQVTGTTATLVLLKGLRGPTAPTGVTGSVTSGSTTVSIAGGTITAADVGLQISGGGIPTNDSIVSITGSPATSLTLAAAATATRTGETLTIHAEAIRKPMIPPTATNASYRACTAPCMTTLLLSGSPSDTFSAPYYDYADDELYVGDDSGNLHQFTGVFNGTPAETTTSWPVTLNASFKVTSPVYDLTSGYVFVGNMGGVFYSVGSGNQGTTSGSIHGTSSALGDAIVDGPLLDPSAGRLYVFVTTNSAASNAVFQFSTNFTSGTGNGNVAGTTVGAGASQYWLYAGNFDNVYYQSAVHTGNLWVAGNTSSNTGGGAVYRIAITANSMALSSTQAITGITGTGPSWIPPIIEFCNNGASACTSNGTNTTAGTDYIFFSVNDGAKAGCTNANGNGCVLSYNITTPSAPVQSGTGLNVTNVGAAGCWATTGIVVDNSSTLAGASQIYFINFDGNTAGGPTGTATSTACAAASGSTIFATQASQSSP